MAQVVDVYLADIAVWNGLDGFGRPGGAKKPAIPPRRPDTDNVVPTISPGFSWSTTISAVIKELKEDHEIDHLYMLGHGKAGEITVGSTLSWMNDADIAQFGRLRRVHPHLADQCLSHRL
jgi:hypothetical protein